MTNPDVPIDLSKFAGHTPGPWHLGKEIIKTLDADGNPRRHIVEYCWPDREKQAHADHLLIAAAPTLLAEVERLNTHAERLSRINREVLAESELLSATVADQAAALAERDKDAERYRWLRKQEGIIDNHADSWRVELWRRRICSLMNGPLLDSAIDAALAASVSTQEEK